MWILPLVGYLGSFVGFSLLTLAIASGLYYLSELVEEHTVIAKRLLTQLIFSVVVIQILLCIVDRFPFWLTLLSILSHVVYLANMRRFPFVKLTDPLFLFACVLVLVNHYVWFNHFSYRQQRAYRGMASSYPPSMDDIPTFAQIASYFGLCVWLVPFALFVSLSASDNVLPTIGSDGPSSTAIYDRNKSRRGQGMAKAVVENIRSAIGVIGGMASVGRPAEHF